MSDTTPEVYPRLVIGAPQGRSGKTTLSVGLCAALAARGFAVQPFKKGPDYIDPSWLSAAAGRPCRSLDPFFLGSEDALRAAFVAGAAGSAISIIEGNHGLYDSALEDGSGSTAAVARALAAPIVLLVNAERMARSAAALVSGYQNFEPGTPLAAVVLNNVARSRHEAGARAAIERYCGIPVLGALPRDPALAIPDRHLGLVPHDEAGSPPFAALGAPFIPPALIACRRAVEQSVDVAALLALAGWPGGDFARQVTVSQALPAAGRRVRIGVVRDRAFTFYYPENLEALVEAGAELVSVDALHDPGLPALDALYIGGGFPEVFMTELAANRAFMAGVRRAALGGLPIYAECGGLMFLARRILWQGRAAEMAGVLPCDVEMAARPQAHGYVLAEALPAHPFLAPGTLVRGHEFHHSRLVNMEGCLARAYRLQRGCGAGEGEDGLLYRNVLAGYTHLHAGGAAGWAAGLVAWAAAGR